jgi:tetratricopeptide (TPR) repeat protein
MHKSYKLLIASTLVFAAVAAYRYAAPGPAPEAPRRAARAVTDNSDAGALRAAIGVDNTGALVETLRAKLVDQPGSTLLNSQLGWALIQQQRETADAALYASAEQAFGAALKADANNVDAMLGQGALALSRHDFTRAIEWGQRASTLNPFRAQAYGVIADAQIELGRYPEAVATVQKMVDTRPDLSSYSRVSYVRELHGDVPGAIDAMRRAVDAGNPTHEGTLWSLYQLGNLHFNSGDLTNAESAYQAALNVKPDYVYAQAGMARLSAARGDLPAATTTYERLVERLPLPEFAIALGELYVAQDLPDKARQQFGLVRAIMKLNSDAKQNVDMELALFEADHGDAANALALAEAAWQKRPSVHAADVLAWAYHKNGRHVEARAMAANALALNTRDAAMRYRAGMIHIAAGDSAKGRALLREALTINPSFSVLYAPEARRLSAAS